MSDKLKIYAILICELLAYPFLLTFHWIQNLACTNSSRYRERLPVASMLVRVCVHEWGGYLPERQKTIKQGATFTCGLKGQLQRFFGQENIELCVTLSEPEKYAYTEMIQNQSAHFIKVPNEGMDFSGYATFYESICEEPNSYVILSNSSVNARQDDFLARYIQYMETHPHIGLLGVSYCTKKVQTLIRPNFTPHLQSFFLVTTIDVLREIVKANNGKFPGRHINHKLLLIRNGEIRLTNLALRLGYGVAVVNPQDGKPYEFENYRNWKLPKGDIRQLIDTPNRIIPMQ